MGRRRVFVATLGILVLTGCTAKSVLTTVALKPANVATPTLRDYHKHEDPAVDCAAKRDDSCYARYDVEPDAVDDAPVAVGLWHDYGSVSHFGFGCWERINCIYRGLVVFDLGALGPSPKIVSAKLRYQLLGTDKHNDATNWSAAEDCIRKVGVVQSPWGGFNLPAEFFTDDVSQEGTAQGIDVSSTVRNWVDGTVPNNGFMLTGPNEHTNKDDDDTCVATVGNFQLIVLLNVAGNP